ncbi:Two domain fusion protein [Desulfamplus magnetovallimortis]|uniref:Ribonuclease 3 n=1 Tax=Desulfamplus magnetovallimortis TaxID=1246637 RepID=A0A1W1HIJ6_9BACT|nr:ribonuclease III [Desulfamplus magnetovallimortis]SLM32212.1 Two domain fusion protein [Desulfamplus magnetovallimortis]
MIDLHIHSTASDGSYSPPEILQMAVKSGLTAISITDHDTTDGVREAIEYGIPHQLEFITGVEISAHPPAEYSDMGTLHILGYGFSIYDRNMIKTLRKLKSARLHRNPRIIEKLNDLGFSLSIQEVENICGPGQIGRPHIARAMLKKGYVSTFDEAFDLYLGKDKAAYVDKFRLSAKEAIDLILGAGGLPVLAHPGIIEHYYQEHNDKTLSLNNTFEKRDKPVSQDNKPGKRDSSLPPNNSDLCRQNCLPRIENLISRLSALGLAGIEVHHTDHTAAQTQMFEKIATKKALVMSGGSDFHGDIKPEISMGKGNGSLNIDHELYRNLYISVDRQKQENPATEKLEINLNHTFKSKSLFHNALYHSSYVNEMQNPDIIDNQRLEFLGDAVLGLAVGHILMEKFPDMKEGDLSKLRASLVSEPALASMARKMDLGRFIYLGKGERLSRGGEKNSILADTFEAIIAAIYLETGFKNTYQLVENYFEPQIVQLSLNNETEDYKSMLQEIVQEMGDFTPFYSVSGESGPDHDKTFEVTLKVCGIETRGQGKNKKTAEQSAAAMAIDLLRHDSNTNETAIDK